MARNAFVTWEDGMAPQTSPEELRDWIAGSPAEGTHGVCGSSSQRFTKHGSSGVPPASHPWATPHIHAVRAHRFTTRFPARVWRSLVIRHRAGNCPVISPHRDGEQIGAAE
ncbi:MAG: hypothetical protein ACLQIB_06110 [Isosphaeraceae bacterium]